ncbi:autotransporter assembly complex protein TamA [Qipengyuania aquimaris]|uniref:autotransporter assembly complex protein TamA n=1 Tax=Qipengyuania aquimaris TaxID=255984 RepID=UPI001CD6FFE1|nr:BamA/TamA family outer membrane protein [Qipengyuania aquimaris]MCA0902799.1 BamA/TamA family outer membrane protein [Qipengyuania aquimaris]
MISYPVLAQDPQAPERLEDLIPDSALEDPEAWAQQGVDAPAEDTSEDIPDPSTPIADPIGIEIAWPDELEIDGFEALEPEEEIEFADLDTGAPVIAFEDAEVEKLADNLVLGFPQAEPPFSERGDFVARYEALSTIEELDDSDANVAQLAARAREDEELLANLLRVYGYYDGEIIRSIGTVAPGDEVALERPSVRFDIIPGARFRYGTINLGNLDAAPDYALLRDTFDIQPGDFLQSDKILQEQFNLDRALGENGYAFAEIDEPELLIDHDRNEGDLTLPVEPGGKYVFGDVVSSDPEFLSGRHIASIARFEPGETYQRSLSLDLRRAVTATGLVSAVSVTPREVQAPVGDEPGVVAMDVEMTRAKLRTIAGAIGYGSEEGFRVQASWEHRNIFPPEGSLRVRGIAGTQEQLAGITFRKNNFGGRDKVLTLDAYASNVDNVAYEARTVAITGTYERSSTLLFQKPLAWALGAEILATDERNRVISGIPRPRQTYFIAAVFGRATIDTTDSLLNPTEGFRLTGYLAPETSRTAGQQYYYLRNQADASYYQSVGSDTVLAGRVRFASIPGAPLFAIAPSRRLYAGGGASVRGYGYQAVGPRNDLGEPVGGRSLVEASVEARVGTGFFDGALSVVPFFDVGSVSIESTPNFRYIKYGAGVGVRYESGFGPLRLDVGVPLNPEPDDAPVAVYVSLGQAF